MHSNFRNRGCAQHRETIFTFSYPNILRLVLRHTRSIFEKTVRYYVSVVGCDLLGSCTVVGLHTTLDVEKGIISLQHFELERVWCM